MSQHEFATKQVDNLVSVMNNDPAIALLGKRISECREQGRTGETEALESMLHERVMVAISKLKPEESQYPSWFRGVIEGGKA